MQRAQLFLFSIVSAMLIFQYEPLMFSKGVSSDISIKTLTAVQILIVVSVYLYRFLFKKYSKKYYYSFIINTQNSGIFVYVCYAIKWFVCSNVRSSTKCIYRFRYIFWEFDNELDNGWEKRFRKIQDVWFTGVCN